VTANPDEDHDDAKRFANTYEGQIMVMFGILTGSLKELSRDCVTGSSMLPLVLQKFMSGYSCFVKKK